MPLLPQYDCLHLHSPDCLSVWPSCPKHNLIIRLQSVISFTNIALYNTSQSIKTKDQIQGQGRNNTEHTFFSVQNTNHTIKIHLYNRVNTDLGYF